MHLAGLRPPHAVLRVIRGVIPYSETQLLAGGLMPLMKHKFGWRGGDAHNET